MELGIILNMYIESLQIISHLIISFFYDDNMFEDFEPSTNIKRSPLSDNVDTVILCSNSIDIQEDMFKQLKTAKTVIFSMEEDN